MRLKTYFYLTLVTLFLAACGGGSGGSSSPGNIVGSEQTALTPNSLVISDMLFSGLGYTNERITNVHCLPDLSLCEATYQGQTFSIMPEEDSDAQGQDTIYTSLGVWNHMRIGAIYTNTQGLEARFAIAGGIRHPNSLSLSGSASWTGEMVALDNNNRLVRGDAQLTIEDLRSDITIDVRLEPHSRPAMTWNDIPVVAGRFSHRQSSSDYIKGEFYGPEAEEAGGVFERDQLIGAFGGRQQ